MVRVSTLNCIYIYFSPPIFMWVINFDLFLFVCLCFFLCSEKWGWKIGNGSQAYSHDERQFRRWTAEETNHQSNGAGKRVTVDQSERESARFGFDDHTGRIVPCELGCRCGRRAFDRDKRHENHAGNTGSIGCNGQANRIAEGGVTGQGEFDVAQWREESIVERYNISYSAAEEGNFYW